MANKKQKSQAEKKVTAAKAKTGSKNSKKATVEVKQEPENKVPVRLISSLTLLAFAILFTILLFSSEGALLKFIKNVFHGLIGRTGFVVSIPVLFYLFFIHAFSGKRPIKLRTVCLAVFVLVCGCISHLNDITETVPKGLALNIGLYKD